MIVHVTYQTNGFNFFFKAGGRNRFAIYDVQEKDDATEIADGATVSEPGPLLYAPAPSSCKNIGQTLSSYHCVTILHAGMESSAETGGGSVGPTQFPAIYITWHAS